MIRVAIVGTGSIAHADCLSPVNVSTRYAPYRKAAPSSTSMMYTPRKLLADTTAHSACSAYKSGPLWSYRSRYTTCPCDMPLPMDR